MGRTATYFICYNRRLQRGQILLDTADCSLSMTYHQIYRKISRQTDVFIMDFAKAVDKVCHSLLVHKDKLHHYGIWGKVNRWIKNWLTNRKQCVVVEGEKSQFVIVFSGVPQGSVLGPCLFFYYINDLQAQLHSTVGLFADDTKQENLNTLAKWEDQWRMKFHPSECEKLTVTSKRNPTETES